MSNSSLVVYTKLSPNKTTPRNHAIDTITIHCMAGNLSVETCGALFAKSSRKASSNYGVGTDGRIALYVDEGNRSWCSSNRANDMRAVTIEVANDGDASTGWHVSEKALQATIALVADICKRNGITELVWSDNKADRVNHRNGCNMTVHRDYAAKACPGDYLMSQMPYIAKTVNNILGVDNSAETNPYPEPTKTVTSKLNAVLKGCKNYINTGDGVKWAQWELARLGFYNMDIDGKAGPGTLAAIKAAQRAYQKEYSPNLEIDGLCGPATRKVLKEH